MLLRAVGALRRLLLAQSQFLDHLLAHDKLLHLAGDGHRERIDEFYVTGNRSQAAV